MNKNNEKVNKLKELYNNYKEAKRDPRKKAGMKLLGYFIFFLIIILIANISSEIEKTNSYTKTTTTTTTQKIDSYVEKQNDLLKSKYNIKYEITYNENLYVINGILENNIINGYLEKDGNIKKIKIINNVLSEITNNSEITLNSEFNIDNIDLNNIINTIKQTSAFIKEKDSVRTYLYEFENKKIYIETEEEYIKNIKIEEKNNLYVMNFQKQI